MSNLKEQAMKDIKKRIVMRMCNWCSDSWVCVRERPCGYFSEHAQEWVDLIEQWLKDNNYYPLQADSDGLLTEEQITKYACQDSTYCQLSVDVGIWASKAQKALCDKEKEEAVNKVKLHLYKIRDFLCPEIKTKKYAIDSINELLEALNEQNL